MKVSAVIPAYNEEKNIEQVLTVLTTCEAIAEVIVVSDGSTDHTVDVTRKYPVQIIELEKNRGKGAAMKEGVNKATGDVILFLDADLVGLTSNHLEKLLAPVLQGRVDMAVGIFEGGRLTTDLAQMVSPYLSGQRVIKRSVVEQLDNMEMTRFGIEVAITRYVRNHHIPYEEVELEEMTHVMKEEKLGFFRGFLYRLQMYWEILAIFFRRKYSSLKQGDDDW